MIIGSIGSIGSMGFMGFMGIVGSVPAVPAAAAHLAQTAETAEAHAEAASVDPLLLVLGIVFLVLNAFFVAAEFGLIATRRTEFEERTAREGRRGASANAGLYCIDHLSVMLAATQLGITVVSLLLGYVAEPTVEVVFERLFDSIGGLPHGVVTTAAVVTTLALVTFVHTVFAEMVPKNLALTFPSAMLQLTALPLRAFTTVFRPIIRFLEALGNMGIRLFGVTPRGDLAAAASVDDIALMVAESAREGVIEEFEHRLLTGALGFGHLDVAAVMIPRPDVVAMPVASSAGAIAATVARSGRSRIPVFEASIDQVIGFVHAKDLLALDDHDLAAPLERDLVRHMLFVPETRRLSDLLLDMRRRRLHFALVVDEHGGTAGVASLEDVLEELVGEIRDEHDRRERHIWRVAGGRFRAAGSVRLDQLVADCGLELPEGDYDTLGGYLLSRLGRIPVAGDTVEVGSRGSNARWRLRVVTMADLRVAQVALELDGPAAPEPE